MKVTEIKEMPELMKVLRYSDLKENDTFLFSKYSDNFVRIKTYAGHISFRTHREEVTVKTFEGSPFKNDQVELIDMELRWSKMKKEK